MAVAGTILFGFYAGLVAVFQSLLSLPILVGISVLFVGIQYKLGKWMALRSIETTELPEAEFPEIHRRFERLCTEMGIEKPKLLAGKMGVPNAFAVGRKGAGVVVVSDTLIELLDEDELEGVLAHELSHIKNRDVIMMVVGQGIASMISIAIFWVIALADDSILATIVAWIVSTLAQMLVMVFVLAVSRYREYVADSDAARYTGNPEALARALAKISQVGRHDDAPAVENDVSALCIFGGKRGLLATLFASHPPIEKRIEKLAPGLTTDSVSLR